MTTALKLAMDLTGDSGDPYFSAVSLLLHFDGSEGSTTFTDSSANAITITAAGDAKITTAAPRVGSGAGSFDGTGDQLNLGSNAAFAFGTGDFTIETYIRFSALPGTNQLMGIANTQSSEFAANTSMWWFALEDSGGTKRLRLGRHGDGSVYAYFNWTPNLNQWYHVAVVRSSSTIYMFVDGVSQTITASSGWGNNFSATGTLTVGSVATFLKLNGYLDEFRITKAARYTANFSPATTAFPDFGVTDPYFNDVSLLLHMDGSNGSTTFVDSSINALTIATGAGSPTLSTSSPKYGTAALSLNGSSYLTVSGNAALFGFPGNFTVEGWVYFNSLPTTGNYAGFFFARGASASASSFQFYLYNNTGTYQLETTLSVGSTDYGNAYVLPATPTTGVWYHFAFVRSGSSVSAYWNGVQAGSTVTVAGIINTPSTDITVGARGNPFPGLYLNGLIDDFRVSRVARYLNAFTPPQTALPDLPAAAAADPYFTKTSLLLHFDGVEGSTTFTDSGPYKLIPTAVGRAQISTNEPRFGSGACRLYGTGNRLEVASNPLFALGSGDFTVEFWINFSAWPTGQISLVDVATSGGFSWYINGSGGFYFSIPPNSLVVSNRIVGQMTISWRPSLNTWYHLALTRSGTNMRMFVNGNLVGSVTASTNYVQGTLQLFTDANCKVDELRITKAARYVGNFTPSPAAFVDQVNVLADPTLPDTRTALLLRMEGVEGSTTFVDSSPNALTVTPFGNTQITTKGFKIGSGAAVFSSNGDYLSVSSSSLFNFGAGDFTVECWIYPTAFTNDPGTIFTTAHSTDAQGIYIGVLSSGYLNFLAGNGSWLFNATTSTNPLNLNTWYHIAYVKNGSSYKVYVNGLESGSASNSGTLTNSNNLAVIGGRPLYNQYFRGRIDELRVTREALYLTKFTPPFTANVAATAYQDKTSLLLHFDGANTSTTFIDSSSNSLVPTVGGNTQISTTGAKFGSGCLSLDGNGDYLEYADNELFEFGSGNFTLEAWIYITGYASNYSGQYKSAIFAKDAVGGRQFSVVLTGTASSFTSISVELFASNAGPTATTINYSFDLNTWYHLAVVRNGTTLTVYLNGAILGTGTNATAIQNVNTAFRIGATAYTGFEYYFNGKIDEVRIVREALYEAGFVVQAEPFKDYSVKPVADPYFNSTCLLMHFDGTNGSTNFVDSGPNSIPMTVNGNAQISTTQSKFGNSSAYFDGNGDYISATNTNITNFSTGDFTVEFWFYSTISGRYSIFDCRTSETNPNGNGFVIGTDDSSRILVYQGSVQILGAAVTTNTWTHVAVCRSGTAIRLFLNGTQTGSTWTTSNSFTDGAFLLGTDYPKNARFVNGYLDELRIVKEALYTAAFTPPAAPFADPGPIPFSDPYFNQVTLLMHMNGVNGSTTFLDSGPAGISTNVTGNAQLSTTRSRFGNSSAYFDGSGDYLEPVSTTSVTFGTGDFTVEFWFYTNNAAVQQNIIDKLGSATRAIYMASNGTLRLYDGSIDAITSSAISAATWYHIALVRFSGVTKLYVNGTQQGSNYTDTASYTNSGNVRIGAAFNNTFSVNGYVDELRITKMARYAGNFSVPTTPFPDFYNVADAAVIPGAALHLNAARQLSLFTDAGAVNAINSGQAIYQWNDLSGNNQHAVQATAASRPTLVAPASGRGGLEALAFNGSQWFSITAPQVNFGTGDFTIECWIKSADLSVLKTPMGTLTSGFDGGWQIVQNNSKFGFGIGVGGGVETYDATVTANTWYHFAVCRAGTTLKTFLNGVNGSTITNSSNISQTGTLNIGWANESAQTGRRFNGQLQNVLIYKGQALYTANFTPRFPVAATTPALVADDPYASYVSLLLRMDGAHGSTAFTDSGPRSLAVTAYGNAQISTANPRFGSGAAEFDGNGDYLELASNPVDFGTGDFTVECWVYLYSVASSMVILRNSTAGGFFFRIGQSYLSAANGLNVAKIGQADNERCAFSFVANTWYHLAAVRQNGFVKFYINGNQQTTTSSGYNGYYVPGGGSTRIGLDSSGTTEAFNGLIDDLKITKGIARYTANFTVTSTSNPDFKRADPYFDKVSLLLHADGTHGSTSFIDSGPNALVVTALGTANITTAVTKFGTGAAAINGAGNVLTIPFNAGFNFGSGDFTIEMWVRFTALPSNSYSVLITHGNSGAAQRWLLYYDTRTSQGSPGLRFSVVNSSNAGIVDFSQGSTAGWAINTWYYVAVTRSGNSWRLFRDGTQLGSTVTDTDAVVDATSTGLVIGAEVDNTSGSLSGFVDDVRVTKGVARSIVVPTAAFPDALPTPTNDPFFANVSTLLHFDGTNDSTTFVDSSLTNPTFTPVGDARILAIAPKFGTGMGRFDGNGDTVTAAANNAFVLGAGDFTVEGWFFSRTVGSSLRGMVDFRTAQTGTNGLMFREDGNGFLVYCNNATILSVASGRTPNAWQHLALVRSGTTLTLYINGVSSATATLSTNLTDNILRLSGFIDTQDSTFAYNGYIEEFRISKSARYTSNFVPQTAAFSNGASNPAADPYYSSTSLLLHMDGTNGSTTFIDSSPNALTVTASGTAQVSTAQSKFGGASASISGSSYLSIDDNTLFEVGSGDFTIEAWVYITSSSGFKAVISKVAGFGPYILAVNGTSYVYYLSSAGTSWELASGVSGGTVSLNTWTHLALVRNGSTITPYLNGTAGTSTTTALALNDNAYPFVIGADRYNAGGLMGDFFNGYIDEVRFTKGRARYVSNFTPSSSAYPDLYDPYASLPVSGAVLWLDAAQRSSLFTDAGATNVNTAGQSIYQWSDLSGSNRHATQTTLANRPTWLAPVSGQNGFSGTTYNGSSQFLTVASTVGWNLVFSGDFTIDVVHKASSTGGVLIGQSNGPGITSKWGFGYGSNGIVGAGYLGLHYNGGGFNGFVRVSWTPTAGQVYRFTVVRVGNDHYFYVNGVQQGSTQTTASRPGNPTQSATVGQLGNGDGGFINNPIYEISAYLLAFNSTQLSQQSAYSLAKWGVA